MYSSVQPLCLRKAGFLDNVGSIQALREPPISLKRDRALEVLPMAAKQFLKSGGPIEQLNGLPRRGCLKTGYKTGFQPPSLLLFHSWGFALGLEFGHLSSVENQARASKVGVCPKAISSGMIPY